MASLMRVRAGLVLVEALRLIVLATALGQIAPAATPSSSVEKVDNWNGQPACDASSNSAMQQRAATTPDAPSFISGKRATLQPISKPANLPGEEPFSQGLRCDRKPVRPS